MFLLRAAFWILLVVMLIPSDPESGDAPRVTVFQAMNAARAAARDVGQFCERNPDVCATSNAAFEVMVDKARYGIKMLTEHFTKPSDEARGTLTDADVAEPWRAPRHPSRV